MMKKLTLILATLLAVQPALGGTAAPKTPKTLKQQLVRYKEAIVEHYKAVCGVLAAIVLGYIVFKPGQSRSNAGDKSKPQPPVGNDGAGQPQQSQPAQNPANQPQNPVPVVQPVVSEQPPVVQPSNQANAQPPAVVVLPNNEPQPSPAAAQPAAPAQADPHVAVANSVQPPPPYDKAGAAEASVKSQPQPQSQTLPANPEQSVAQPNDNPADTPEATQPAASVQPSLQPEVAVAGVALPLANVGGENLQQPPAGEVQPQPAVGDEVAQVQKVNLQSAKVLKPKRKAKNTAKSVSASASAKSAEVLSAAAVTIAKVERVLDSSIYKNEEGRGFKLCDVNGNWVANPKFLPALVYDFERVPQTNADKKALAQVITKAVAQHRKNMKEPKLTVWLNNHGFLGRNLDLRNALVKNGIMTHAQFDALINAPKPFVPGIDG